MNDPFVFSPGWTPITPQRVFDAAWQAFIVEDKPPAIGANGRCAYLTEGGSKCAIGLCIPDGHPAQMASIYADGVSALRRNYPGLFPDDEETLGRLVALQYALHDGLTANGRRWRLGKTERERGYRAAADNFGLTIPGEQS